MTGFCGVCGTEIKVMAFRGDPECSVLCEKEAAKRPKLSDLTPIETKRECPPAWTQAERDSAVS